MRDKKSLIFLVILIGILSLFTFVLIRNVLTSYLIIQKSPGEIYIWDKPYENISILQALCGTAVLLLTILFYFKRKEVLFWLVIFLLFANSIFLVLYITPLRSDALVLADPNYVYSTMILTKISKDTVLNDIFTGNKTNSPTGYINFSVTWGLLSGIDFYVLAKFGGAVYYFIFLFVLFCIAKKLTNSKISTIISLMLFFSIPMFYMWFGQIIARSVGYLLIITLILFYVLFKEIRFRHFILFLILFVAFAITHRYSYIYSICFVIILSILSFAFNDERWKCIGALPIAAVISYPLLVKYNYMSGPWDETFYLSLSTVILTALLIYLNWKKITKTINARLLNFAVVVLLFSFLLTYENTSGILVDTPSILIIILFACSLFIFLKEDLINRDIVLFLFIALLGLSLPLVKVFLSVSPFIKEKQLGLQENLLREPLYKCLYGILIGGTLVSLLKKSNMRKIIKDMAVIILICIFTIVSATSPAMIGRFSYGNTYGPLGFFAEYNETKDVIDFLTSIQNESSGILYMGWQIVGVYPGLIKPDGSTINFTAIIFKYAKSPTEWSPGSIDVKEVWKNFENDNVLYFKEKKIKYAVLDAAYLGELVRFEGRVPFEGRIQALEKSDYKLLYKSKNYRIYRLY